jgi:hypothetical protein
VLNLALSWSREPGRGRSAGPRQAAPRQKAAMRRPSTPLAPNGGSGLDPGTNRRCSSGSGQPPGPATAVGRPSHACQFTPVLMPSSGLCRIGTCRSSIVPGQRGEAQASTRHNPGAMVAASGLRTGTFERFSGGPASILMTAESTAEGRALPLPSDRDAPAGQGRWSGRGCPDTGQPGPGSTPAAVRLCRAATRARAVDQGRHRAPRLNSG